MKKDGQYMKKRKVGDLVSGAGSSSSDECTEAQVSVCVPRRACKLRVMFYPVPKAIELARTLKPEDAMRVRANEVKVGPGSHIRTFSFIENACPFLRSPHIDFQGAEFWSALESVFRPFESRDLEFLRTSATLDEDSAMRVLDVDNCLSWCAFPFILAPSKVPPIQRVSVSTKKDAKGKTKVLRLVPASKEPTTVFDMCPVWFRLCCALVDNDREDAVQSIRDMNRVSNIGINLSCQDLNIGALAGLQVIPIAHVKSYTYLKQESLVAGYRCGFEVLVIQVFCF